MSTPPPRSLADKCRILLEFQKQTRPVFVHTRLAIARMTLGILLGLSPNVITGIGVALLGWH